MADRLVWFLLVDQHGVAYKGTTASSVSIRSNYVIDQFRDAVKTKYADSHLEGIDPSDLLVYADKKAFGVNTADAPTNLRVEGENEEVGLGTDEDHALLVVVPDQDDMNPSYFIEPNIQGNVKNSIFRILDTGNADKAVGMGVFFRNNLAVTCRHNLADLQVVNSMVTVRAPNSGQEVVIQLRVVYRDTDLDFAILQSHHPRPFMLPWTGNPVNLRGCNLVLASFIDPYLPMYQNEIGFYSVPGIYLDLFKFKFREQFRDHDFQQSVLTKLYDLHWQGSQQEYATKFLCLLSQFYEELSELVKRWMHQRN
ncbi:CRN domain containing hypothetical protein-containing protein, partial [Phytophthora palmivora]